MTVQYIAGPGGADHRLCERIAARRPPTGGGAYERLAAMAIAACARRRGWCARCARCGACALAVDARALPAAGRARR